MLILSRRPGQKIAIGDDIMITVVEVSGDRIKVGIEAPDEVVILRQELCEAVIEENKAAATRARPEQPDAALALMSRWLPPARRSAGATVDDPAAGEAARG